MLSYRHAFHAGNHADVLKHLILYCVLNYFNQKDKPYWYIDTHSGAGLYDLQGDAAQKIAEYRHGIDRIRKSTQRSVLLEQFIAHLHQMLPEENAYAGSPLWAQSLLREGDKMRLFELHHHDFSLLIHNARELKWGKRAIIKQEDGFQGLLSLLPPPTRRAIMLIDPPYELKSDYAQVVKTLKVVLNRFATGCYLLWYPCLSRAESFRLPEELKKLPVKSYVHAQLHVRKPNDDGFGMHGSGMFVLNPPYVLAEQLRQTLPELTQLLAQDNGAHFVLDAHID